MVTARTALLQALRQGPGYGRLLMRRVADATGRRASLAPGSVYPGLRALERAGLVRKWTVVTGGVRGGRSRTYHELTVAGVREAEAEAGALSGLLLASPSRRETPAAEQEALRARVERVEDLLDFVREARASLARTRRRA
jgi:PadR family transcriptional regulator PadR